MWHQIFITVITIQLVFCEDLGELVFVNILFRHGNRTPTGSYPKDPYRNLSTWPVNWGQLTNEGKMQQYQLGKWLRERYNGFLPEIYSDDDIYVQSTDVDRTLMSAYCNLAGLYEPKHSNWNEDIKWQPIPVHTTPENLDYVLSANKLCPKYDALLDELLRSEEIVKLNEKYQDLFVYLTANTGYNVTSVRDVGHIYGILVAEDLHGFKLPNWTKTVYPQPITHIREVTFQFSCSTVELSRLKVGPLIEDMLKHFEDKMEEKITEKMWMYSAHDTTIVNLLKALNVFDGSLPPYASCVMLELRRKGDQHFVALYYKNSTVSEVDPFLLTIPQCEKLCPLQKFITAVTPLIPEVWEDECRV